jgi:hypothetical protein
LFPSLAAAILSAVLQGIGQSSTSATLTNYTNGTANSTVITYTQYTAPGRNQTIQGGYQMAGWAISIGCGALAGLIIGLIYRILNDNF